MTDYDPKMIDAIGFAMAEFMGTPWNGMPDEEKAAARPLIATALSALPLTPAALNALYRGEAVVVNETTGLPYIESDALKARE